jgi:ABC-type sugar transport system ATPase subunit
MNLFKARLTHEAGRAVLRGDGFMLPAPAWLPAAVQGPEQALVVGVRPQSLRPTDQAEALPIQVDVVEYLGTESQIVGHLQVPDGQRICATLAGDAKALLHKGVRLAVDAPALHVFDAASGRSLRPQNAD